MSFAARSHVNSRARRLAHARAAAISSGLLRERLPSRPSLARRLLERGTRVEASWAAREHRKQLQEAMPRASRVHRSQSFLGRTGNPQRAVAQKLRQLFRLEPGLISRFAWSFWWKIAKDLIGVAVLGAEEPESAVRQQAVSFGRFQESPPPLRESKVPTNAMRGRAGVIAGTARKRRAARA